MLCFLSFIVPVLSVACSRLILSLRGLYFKQEISDGDPAEGTVDQRIFCGSISIPPDTLTTFVAVRMGPEPGASLLSLSCGSQISAVVDAERSGPRIEDEETVAGTSMGAVREVVTQSSSTRKDNSAGTKTGGDV